MTTERRALMEPRLERLLANCDSRFSLVTLSSSRAREINDYYNQLGEGLGRIVPPQVTSVSRKPLSIALEEIEAGKIIPRFVDPEAEALEAAAVAAVEADALAEAIDAPAEPAQEPPAEA